MSTASEENKCSDETHKSTEEEGRGVKRAGDKLDVNVHTPNDWEHARLEGGDDRKQKFLRLMGASKKEQTGKTTGGNQEGSKQHGRSEEEEKELKSNLEKSFETNLEYKLTGGARKHKGLGFQEEDKIKDVQEKESTNSEKPEADNNTAKGDEKDEEAKKKDEEESDVKDKDSENPVEEKKPDNPKKYSMSFVKSSS